MTNYTQQGNQSLSITLLRSEKRFHIIIGILVFIMMIDVLHVTNHIIQNKIAFILWRKEESLSEIPNVILPSQIASYKDMDSPIVRFLCIHRLYVYAVFTIVKWQYLLVDSLQNKIQSNMNRDSELQNSQLFALETSQSLFGCSCSF